MKSFVEEYGKVIIVAIVVVALIVIASLFASDGSRSIEGIWRNFALKAGFPNYEMVEAPKTVNAGETATFKSEAEFSKFVEVQVDGQTVDSASYTVAESPTVVTLTGEYTSTLDAGRHTLDIISNDGFARAEFTVKAYGITFTDGKQLSWDQIIAGVDSDKYGYDPSKIRKNATNVLINSYAFKANENVAEISFAYNTNVSFSGYSFYKCMNLKSISMPKSFDTADSVFSDCNNLRILKIPEDGSGRIYWGSFERCGFEKVIIPKEVYFDRNSVFSNCNNLKEVELADGFSNLGESYAFGDCSNLTKITIPVSVVKIPASTLLNCTSLSTILYKGTKEQWNVITKGTNWKRGVPSACVVKCTDGDIAIDNAG